MVWYWIYFHLRSKNILWPSYRGAIAPWTRHWLGFQSEPVVYMLTTSGCQVDFASSTLWFTMENELSHVRPVHQWTKARPVQSRLATYARCCGIFNIHWTANLPENLLVKKILKSVYIWQNCGDESVAPFFWPTLYSVCLFISYAFQLILLSSLFPYLPLPLHSLSFTIRYDTRCYFNVRSKADISQLNLPHGTDN